MFRVIRKSRGEHTPLGGFAFWRKQLKSPRRRPTRKAKATPEELAAHFREWQELRIKVSEAELAAARTAEADVETKVEGDGRSSRKPRGRGRMH
jgi:hypothetical protein